MFTLLIAKHKNLNFITIIQNRDDVLWDIVKRMNSANHLSNIIKFILRTV